ncbi:MAG TPA: NUDIX hydrolase [Burkholderiaceae bacterium]|nr:NUDIX hydrolase [Burkholderiaceae bacterium]
MSERLKETTVDTELAWSGAFLRVRKDRARLPDGSIHGREWVEHPGAAAVLALGDDGRVLVERQWRYAMGRAYLEIPAGKIDPGETTLQTARRELLEETGYVAREWALLTQLHPAIGFSNEVMDVFVARGLELRQATALDHGELLEIEWMTLDDLLAELAAGRVPDVKTHIAVLHLQRMVRGLAPWPAFSTA